MILTCPHCSARFMIDAAALGDTGRTVRCGACGNAWHQFPEPAAEEPYAPAAAPAAVAPAMAMAQAGAAAASAAAAAAEAEVADHARRRPEKPARAEPRRASRGALGRVLIWFAFMFVIAVIALGGYRFRQDVVYAWPPAMRLYQALGLKVDPPAGFGLRVPEESIKFRREAEGGVPILVISGEILNGSDRPQKVVPMRITLFDKDQRELRTELIKIDERELDPGKRLPFQTSIPRPPSEATEVRITFVLTGG